MRNPSTRVREFSRRLEHEIVAEGARRPGARAVDVEVERRAGRERERIAASGEDDEAFEVVVAVGPTAEHVQRQVDLGGRTFDEAVGHGDRVKWRKPRAYDARVSPSSLGYGI